MIPVAIITTNNPGETHNAGRAMAQSLTLGDMVIVAGDLGAGKTTLVKGICEGLGAKPREVRSPTFTLVNEYQGTIPIRHADLYRVESLRDLETTGLFDGQFEGVTLVEWGERLAAQSRTGAIIIRIEELGESQRRIIVENPQTVDG
ncbi:MAG: tRNA (adenosine(37)-N6)-threonylcarbamoyltransferase complex ATPase subunit type 1 TsaE [Nitrospinae bacterium]|nr:tRNA (adenosine(37)-N6)-threonylcarbamoyltransferase complex ATPase subunit type 1 TsaE [Nitrospinota bacterium]